MPSLQITVYEDAAEVALGDPILEEVVTVTGTSALSSVIPAGRTMRRMRLLADVDVFVTWGEGTPEAKIDGSSGRMLAAESPEYFAIEPGHFVAVIARRPC